MFWLLRFFYMNGALRYPYVSFFCTVLPPAKEATEPTPPTTGRRTSLLSMFTPCPREATIHVTLQRRKRRGTVSPVKKLARAKALDRALND